MVSVGASQIAVLSVLLVGPRKYPPGMSKPMPVTADHCMPSMFVLCASGTDTSVRLPATYGFHSPLVMNFGTGRSIAGSGVGAIGSRAAATAAHQIVRT